MFVRVFGIGERVVVPLRSTQVWMVDGGVENRNSCRLQRAGEGERFGQIGLPEILGVHPKTSRAGVKGIESNGEDGVGIGLVDAAEGFEQEAHPVFQRAAETAWTIAGSKEFFGQRAAMARDIDAIKSCCHCGFGGLDQRVEMGFYGSVIQFLGARRSKLGNLYPVTRRWERRGGLRIPDQRKASIGEVLVVSAGDGLGAKAIRQSSACDLARGEKGVCGIRHGNFQTQPGDLRAQFVERVEVKWFVAGDLHVNSSRAGRWRRGK